MNDVPLVFLIAGEPSGDAIGGRLMAELKAESGGKIRFAGIGGAAMQGEGLTSLFPMSDLSIMGLAEIVPHIPKLLGRIRQTIASIMEQRPAAVVTIDAPAFNFRVASRLKGKGFPLIHYVAPTVWAWRPGRAGKIAQFLDHLLVLLPFEPPYFTHEGLPCTFVGHPVVESGADGGDARAFRQRHGIPENAPVLCLLPGSRISEINGLIGVFKETVQVLFSRHKGLRVIVPTMAHVAGLVERETATWPKPPIVTSDVNEKFDAFAASDVALAASGTVSLELAMAGTPMVIAYRVNPLTAFLARRLVRVNTVTLLNIVLDRQAVPEFLQERCRPDLLSDAVSSLFDDPKARLAQKEAAKEGMVMLGVGGPSPSRKAAEAVLQIIREHDGMKNREKNDVQ